VIDNLNLNGSKAVLTNCFLIELQAIIENPSLLMAHLTGDRKQFDADAGNVADAKKDQRRKKASGMHVVLGAFNQPRCLSRLFVVEFEYLFHLCKHVE